MNPVVLNETQTHQGLMVIFMFVRTDTELVKAHGLSKKINHGVWVTVEQLALRSPAVWGWPVSVVVHSHCG